MYLLGVDLRGNLKWGHRSGSWSGPNQGPND